MQPSRSLLAAVRVCSQPGARDTTQLGARVIMPNIAMANLTRVQVSFCMGDEELSRTSVENTGLVGGAER